MPSPVELAAALTVGTVESVSPAEIKVLLELDAPQALALNAGVPHSFPRINGYLLIPSEAGALVGMIVWLGVERSAFPKRTGLKDFGLIDLPYPLRKLILTPLGMLVRRHDTTCNGYSHFLERGVAVFPSVGDPVLLPTVEQLKNIVEAAHPSDRRVPIGTSPLAMNARVTVDPNKLFGRHLAVLGNTGSGKSCSVAGLIRWSLDAAKSARKISGNGDGVNARFIILDPNGEYSSAFADFGTLRRFRVSSSENNVKRLVVPAWMWNSQEWCAFAQAAPGAQRPLLLQALRDMRAGQAINEPVERHLCRDLKAYRCILEGLIAAGPTAYTGTQQASHCGRILSNVADTAGRYIDQVPPNLMSQISSLHDAAASTADQHHWDGDRMRRSRGYNAFGPKDILDILDSVKAILALIPDTPAPSLVSEDAPVQFSLRELPDHLDMIASETGGGQAAQFVATLSMRIRMLLADRRLGPVVGSEESESHSFAQWLVDYIGNDGSINGALSIIDLSLVPSDVVHIVVAVIGRIIFEATQRYHQAQGVELPTVLVLEEAHTFVHRGEDRQDGVPTPSQMCRQTFERIAREGRKFGLGLVLSSQRPSELSPTVLAQCNTFLLHRIVNDRDQELVGKLVPDNLAGILRELPSLPSKQAILLGWAAAVPALVEISELPEAHRPRSADPKFWEVWTGEEQRVVDWNRIADEWTGIDSPSPQNRADTAAQVAGPEDPPPAEDDIPF